MFIRPIFSSSISSCSVSREADPWRPHHHRSAQRLEGSSGMMSLLASPCKAKTLFRRRLPGATGLTGFWKLFPPLDPLKPGDSNCGEDRTFDYSCKVSLMVPVPSSVDSFKLLQPRFPECTLLSQQDSDARGLMQLQRLKLKRAAGAMVL